MRAFEEGRRDYFAEAKAEFEELAQAAGLGRHPLAEVQPACDFPIPHPYCPFNADQRAKEEFEALLVALGH